jgi:ubiquinone/menaquinone biosynthesis C-methylase UbiE
MVNYFKQALGDIEGGRVLDVATKEGGFVRVLVDNLGSYSEIVGVDINAHAIEAAQNSFDQEDIRFILMDAERLSFEDEGFDTVSISASLHHLENISRVLAEMKRVLKTGGHFIVAEIHRDGKTEAQLTSIHIHHWLADIDSALGISHHRTLARQEVMDYVVALGLRDVTLRDISDTESVPKNAEKITELEGVIDRNIMRAGETSNSGELTHRGEELRRRLREVGVQKEPGLLVVGKKP